MSLRLALFSLLVSRAALGWPFVGGASGTNPAPTPNIPKPSSSPTAPPGTSDVCDIDERSALRRTYIKRAPSYFFRAFPDSMKVSYASNAENFILDLETGREKLIPGLYDPVPTHDERYMTIPNIERGLGFYTFPELEARKNEAKPVLEDVQVKGVYQSTGIVADGPEETTYRVITDQSAVKDKRVPSYRDYPVTHRGKDDKPDVYVSTLEPRPLCPDRELSLPMLSRDGKQLAAVENNPDGTRTTKIFDLDTDKKTCTVSLDLGFETGKVDFAFNNDDITFHVSSNSLDSVSGYFYKPGEHFVSNVYVYKRSTKEIRRITNNAVGNSVYPSFRRDGTIVYVTHGPEIPGMGAGVVFTHADPTRERAAPLRAVVADDCCGGDRKKKTEFEALVALGSLWAHACTRYGTEFDVAPAALTPLGLDPVRCRRLVFDYWKDLRDPVSKGRQLQQSKKIDAKALADLDVRDLLAACPPLLEGAEPEPAVSPATTVRPFEEPKAEPTAEAPRKKVPTARATGSASRSRVLPGRLNRPEVRTPAPSINPVASCIACHANIPFNDIAKLKAMKPLLDGSDKNRSMYDEIWSRIQRAPGTPGAMPMGAQMGCKQRKALVCYLNSADSGCKVECP